MVVIWYYYSLNHLNSHCLCNIVVSLTNGIIPVSIRYIQCTPSDECQILRPLAKVDNLRLLIWWNTWN
jgi:hypothetical protein